MPVDPYNDVYTGDGYSHITPAVKAITIDPYSDDYTPANDNDEVSYRSTSASASAPPATSNSPSEEYLNITKKQSTHIEDPTSVKKLLILDLNGTLIYREPHRPPPASDETPAGDSAQKEKQSEDVYRQFNNGPRPLRVVHNRPYMTSFREYLFHPSTRKWLDTMVWSSAQPHSVSDMVERCFGEDAVEEDDPQPTGTQRRGRGRGRRGANPVPEVDEFGREKRGKLIAVWARDTLGLSPAAYNKNTQTTKDLSKPWYRFRNHSAETTLLLDDSLLKAKIQPHNHLCVPEYTKAMREWDVGVVTRGRLSKMEAHEVEAEQVPVLPDVVDQKPEDEPSLNPSIKRKRSKPASFDRTLLAVIGILDAIKHQANVSSWIRDGGIWDAKCGGDTEDEEENVDRGGVEGQDSEIEDGLDQLYLDASPDLGNNRESDTDPNMRKKAGPKARWRTKRNTQRKRRKVTGDDAEAPLLAEGASASHEDSGQETEGDNLEVEQSTHVDGESAGTSKDDENLAANTSAATLTDADTSQESMAPPSFSSTSSLKKPSPLTYTESIGTFEPVTTFLSPRKSESSQSPNVASPTDSIPGLGRDVVSFKPLRPAEPTPPPIMWYQDKETRSYWAGRGEKALDELGIECIPGVMPPPEAY